MAREVVTLRTIFVSTFLVLVVATPGKAVDTYWQADTGNWSTGANWSGGEPGSGDRAFISNGGTAEITQTGEVCRRLEVGLWPIDRGTCDLSGAGELSAGNEIIGVKGEGIFTQTGGSNTTSGELYMGEQPGSSGTYELSGGELSVGPGTLVGFYGIGLFTQTGGSHTISGGMVLARFAGSRGTYELSSTGELSVYKEIIGGGGTGVFIQTGGTNTITDSYFCLGRRADSDESNGTYQLSGTGQLHAPTEFIGWYGTGLFTQSGGSNIISGDLYVGHDIGSNGTYTISEGNLTAGKFIVGLKGSGSLNITSSAAEVTVSDSLEFGPHSTLTAGIGATVHMTGSNFRIVNTEPSDLAGLSNLELIFEGGAEDIDIFEAAGEDMGEVIEGLDSNFALGTLTLGGADTGQIQIVDNSDNQPDTEGSEALYVHNLSISAGSYLDLNGYNLNYLEGVIDSEATIIYNGGNLIQLAGNYDGGDGTEGNPFQINNVTQMNEIGRYPEDWDKHSILTADIDLSGYTGTEFNIIGNFDSPFTGSFDGNDHVAGFLTIDTTYDNTGLFGCIGEGGVVRNLGLAAINVTGGDYLGGLVGNNEGTISSCYVTGSVSGGYIEDYVGGMVGINSGTISSCYATNEIRAVDSWYVGGLVGSNTGSISNCYATGTVTPGWPDKNGGGGGLVGSGSAENVLASFWNMQTSGQSTSGGGIGKKTAEMQMASTFTDVGWDFVGETTDGTEDIWRMCVDGVDYPLLWRQFNKGDFDCPDGVDLIDFSVLTSAWGAEDGQPAWNHRCDISDPDDNRIDESDLEVFGENWLSGIE